MIPNISTTPLHINSLSLRHKYLHHVHNFISFCFQKTMYKDEIKVPNSGNRDLDEACRHRLYKSPYMKKQIDESTTRLIFNTGVSTLKVKNKSTLEE